VCVLFNDAVNFPGYIAFVLDERMNMEHWWNDTDGGKTEISRKENCPSATLSTINPIWTGMGLNLGLRARYGDDENDHGE
jgi:hypothetical protein